jgi:hypothetical protein
MLLPATKKSTRILECNQYSRRVGDLSTPNLGEKGGIGPGGIGQALYAHMQRMSMRFFTHTKTGEMMPRLNNAVNGAQQR